MVDQDIQLHQRRLHIALQFIVERSIASGTGLKCIEEIIDDLVERQLIFKQSSGLLHVFHAHIDTPAFLAQFHNGTDKFRGDHDLCVDKGFFHVFDLGGIRQI